MNEPKPQIQKKVSSKIDSELARKILLEFEMIELHGHSSDHIGEIEERLRKIADGDN